MRREKYNVVYQEGKKDPEFEGDFVCIENDTLLDIFIKDEINRVFNEEIDICKRCFNDLPEFKLKTRYMKTRWGLCRRKRCRKSYQNIKIKNKNSFIWDTI